MAKKAKTKATKKPGTAVAVHKAQPPAAPATFLEYLDRASRDPTFSAEKFQIIVAAKRQEDRDNAEAEFDRRMAQAQAEMQPIRADMENPSTNSNYASDVTLDRAIRPIYSRHGFGLQFGTGETPPPDHVRVTCRVSCAGHRMTEHIDIPIVTVGPKGNTVMTKTHATISATSYGRRVLLMLIFNLMVTGKKKLRNGQRDPMADDDGNAASGISDEMISDAQVKRLQKLLDETKSNVPRFLEYLGEKTISSIPISRFDEAIRMLEAKKRQPPAAL